MNEISYFIFSDSQYSSKEDRAKRINKKFSSGLVLVNGNWKQYTDIVTNLDNLKFSDSVVITSGIKSEMKYKREQLL